VFINLGFKRTNSFLFLDGAELASPVEAEIQNRIEDCWDVIVERRPVSGRGPEHTVICSALVQWMAGQARDLVPVRQSHIPEKPLAEGYFRRVKAGGDLDWRNRLRCKYSRPGTAFGGAGGQGPRWQKHHRGDGRAGGDRAGETAKYRGAVRMLAFHRAVFEQPVAPLRG
jgi:hypothetical protein